MERKQLIAVGVVIALVCVAAGAIILSSNNEDNKLIVETSPDFAPYSYTVDGDYVGLETDIIRAAAESMGYTVEFRQGSTDSILTSVSEGKVDIGAAGFTAAPEGTSLRLSDPYLEVRQVLVVPEGSDIQALEDLEGKKIAVLSGSAGEAYANGVDSAVIESCSTSTDVVRSVADASVDCGVIDLDVAFSLAFSYPEVEIKDIITDSPVEKYVVVFSEGNAGLQEKFNKALQRIRDTGVYDKVTDHYESYGYAPDTPSYYKYERTIIVETSPDFPPMDYMYGSSFVGIDMDILRAVGYDLHWKFEFRNNNFDSIIMSVQQGKADMGASGFTISEDRKEQVLFSSEYFESRLVVVAPKDTAIETFEDVKDKNISVQTGTSGADYAETISDSVIFQKTYTDVVQDLISGKADCEIVDNVVGYAQAARNPQLTVLDILVTEPEYYGFIFAKSNQALCDQINESLARLEADGTIDRINQYYRDNNFLEVPSYYSSQDPDGDGGSGSGGFWGDLYDRIYNDFIKNERYSYIFEGLKNTIIIAFLALIIGLSLGAVVAMVRSTYELTRKLRIASGVCKAYTTVIRGTPVMLQLLIIYYVIFATSSLGSVWIAAVAFGINSGAYVAEVVRSGINAVPKGQMEACRSLGMSNRMAMVKVILPQAVRNILPALGNESISLLKETSIAGYIGIMDLTRGVDIIRGQTYDALLPLLVAGAIYLAIVLVLAYLFSRLERRLNDAY